MTKKVNPDDAAAVLELAAIVADVAARKAIVVKIEGVPIKPCLEFRYVGSVVTGSGSAAREIQVRRGKMAASYYKFKFNVFQNRQLDYVKKLHLFRVFAVSAGLYNCSAWTCSDATLFKLNTSARKWLMRIFGL